MIKLKLNKSQILKNRAEFSSTVRNGTIHKSKYFIVAAAPGSELQVGFTTRGGVQKVVRNRRRRLARELWRTCQREYRLTGKLVFIVREGASTAPYQLLASDYRDLLARLQRSLAASEAEQTGDRVVTEKP